MTEADMQKSEMRKSLRETKKAKYRLNKVSVFDVVLYTLMGLLALIMAFPFYYMLIVSIGTYESINSGVMYLFPTVVDWSSYQLIFTTSSFLSSILVTLFITIVGTGIGIIVSVAGAYPMSKKDMPGNKLMFNMIIITMFFGGGMIPTYLIIQKIGLIDSIWSMIWPCLTGSFNIILLKNFFEELPPSLEESAKIDGANDFVILFKIVIPMSMPVIATISLFLAVGHWNEYFNGILYIIDQNKYPLQLVLRGVLLDAATNLSGAAAQIAANEKPFYAITLQMAIAAIATIPIVVVYPFIQKYFTAGIMLGAVKG